MLIVQGTFHLDPADRDAFVAGSAENMRIAATEPGCLEYVIAAHPIDPGRAILSERWESMDDLNEHTRGINARRKAAADTGGPARPTVVMSDIAIYHIESVQQMG